MTRRLIAVIALCAAASEASGQERPERIFFSALDRTNKPVLGLRGEDFTLKVDGRVAPLEDLRPARPADDKSTPLIAWILLSAYRPISSRLIADQAAAAAGAFTLLHPESALGVQVISDRVETLAPLGNDPAALRRAFNDYGSRRIELRAGPSKDIVPIGQGGILAAIEHAMDSMDRYVAERRAQSGTDVHRAVIAVALPLVPSYYHFYPGREALLDHAARDGVFFYPIFVPRGFLAGWMEPYFELAKKTAGLVSVFGSLRPALDWRAIGQENDGPNALAANLLQIVRDVNGKYSFAAPRLSAGASARLELRSRRKDVEVRLQRRRLP
jgi:hypothetical protein